MADFIFKKLVTNRQAIYDEAIAMAGDLFDVKMTDSNDKERVENNVKQIDKLKKQIAVLVDMCTEGDISREVFRQKKQKLEDQIINLEKANIECKQQILESEDDKLKQKRIESMFEFAKMQAFDPRAKIPETMIDAFVNRVVFDKGVFSWYLNPKLGNDSFKVDTTDWKKNMLKVQKKTLLVNPSTGCYSEQTLIDSACIFLGTFEIPRDFMEKSAKLYYKDRRFKFPEKLVFKLFLV